MNNYGLTLDQQRLAKENGITLEEYARALSKLKEIKTTKIIYVNNNGETRTEIFKKVFETMTLIRNDIDANFVSKCVNDFLDSVGYSIDVAEIKQTEGD